MKTIPYGKHYIDEDDIKSVVNVLKYKNLTQGDEVDQFEKAVAKYVGAKYAVAVSSWTSGLHIAHLALNIGKKDKVITSPITFVASSNSSLYVGAEPIFSDIDENTINLCPKRLEETIKSHSGVKCIIPVHYAGLPCDMEQIYKLAKQNNLKIIEDAAHALGAKYADGTMVGSCKYSEITGFSFHPVKSIAAGEGGMLTTNSFQTYKKLLRLRSHGINKLDDEFLNKKSASTENISNPWYYEMQELGFNYRITDIQCALGNSQLKKLNKFIEKRKKIVAKYDNAFRSFNNIRPIQLDDRAQSSFHIYVIRINYLNAKITRAELMTKLKSKGIITQVHYIPVVSQPYYQTLGYSIENLPNANKFYDEALSIPLYFSLSDKDQDFVISLLKKLIG